MTTVDSPRPFTATVVARAGGMLPVTLSAWHKRFGFLPETKPDDSVRRYSLSDACALRLTVVLTQHGVSAKKAISFANHHAFLFDLLLNGDDDHTWFVLFG